MQNKRRPLNRSGVNRERSKLSGAALAARNADEGKTQPALAWARSTMAKSAAPSEELAVAGQIFFKLQDYQPAVECFQRLADSQVDQLDLRLLHACSLAAMGQTLQAIALIDLNLKNLTPRDLLRFAHYLEHSGAIDEAIHLLSTATTEQQTAELSLELARLIGNKGEPERAIQLLEHGLQSNFQQPEHRSTAYLFLGIFLQRAQAPIAKIEGCYRASIEALPTSPRGYINLAILFNQAGRFQETLDLLEPVAMRFDNLPKLIYLIAVAHRMLDAFDQSIAYLRRIVANHDFPPAWELLGRCLTECGQYDAAVDHYRRWLTVKPGQPIATHMLAAMQGEQIPGRASREYVVETFDAFAETFENTLVRLQYRGPEYIQHLITQKLGLPPDAPELHVLDAGCGTGLVGPVLRPYAKSLVGVDLSASMLELAATKRIYDQLECDDLEAYLQQHPGQFDLIVAADTFNYFGDLASLMPTALAALTGEGWLMFTLEEGLLTEETYQLRAHGRFAHSPAYIINCLGECGLSGGTMTRVVMRKENDREVFALLIAIQRPEL